MKSYYSVLASLLLLMSCHGRFLAAQVQTNGPAPRYTIESKQGRSDEPDVIAHTTVSKDTKLRCAKVGSYPKNHRDDGHSCIVKFENGGKHTLAISTSMLAPVAGEVYLECPGDKPTDCILAVF